MAEMGPLQPAVPGREAVGRAAILKAAGPTKANLRVLDMPGGAVVIKDYGDKPWWTRIWAGWQIARECRAYAFAGPQPFLPRLLGRIDRLALALERIPGEQLADVHGRYPDKQALLSSLRAAIDALHARGIVHLDLRGRENVMVTPDGRIYILDLGGALWLRPGGLLHRLLFPWLVTADEAAWIKWKEMLSPGNLDARERAFDRRFRRLRALWIFNLKGAWRRKV